MKGLRMAYDENNVFAKIIRGEMPCHQVYEDDETLAFMDIMPRSDGHSLIVPKTSARSILDAKPEQLAAVMRTVQKISQASLSAFDAQGITIHQFNEPAGGQVVFHFHFHVLPRRDGEKMRPPGTMADQELLAQHAEKLKAALEGS